MKLSEYAKKHYVSRQTAYKWFKDGKIPNAEQLPTGTIIIHDVSAKKEYTVIYARVNTKEERETELEEQVNRVSQFCLSKGWKVKKVIKEVGDGITENRKKFNRLLENDEVTRIVVESKDRLIRFGFSYFETLFKSKGIEIIVLNEGAENRNDLIYDYTTVTRSVSSKLYGKYKGGKKTQAIIKEFNKE